MRHPIRILLLLTATLFLISACAAPRITAPPVKPKFIPAKRPPSGTRVPGTQRPYVIKGRTYYPLPSSEGFSEKGIASWYGKKFHGRKTANGETYDMYGETAAHKPLPMNTHLLVENLENNREMIVRVNDRGPFVRGRVIDLTLTGARKLGMVSKGTAKVRLTALGEAVSYKQDDKTLERFLPHQDFETGDFYVQIGSFANKSNAQRLKDKMQSWGKKTVVLIYNSGDTVFYRVQIKAGANLTGAKRVEKVLEEAGFPGFVVAR